MKVGLNLLHLVPGETGGSEVYAMRLVPALLERSQGLRLTLFCSREGAPALRELGLGDRAEVIELPVEARSRARRVLAEQVRQPGATRRAGVELLHNVFSTGPARSPVPQVTTIHDLIHRTHPEAHGGPMALGMRGLVSLAARRSRRIIAISGATKRDVVRLLGIGPERVDVVYLGPGFRPVDQPAPEPELRERHSLGEAPIVLSPSARRPHKNLERLIEAMGLIDSPAVLVVPGYETRWERGLRERAESAGRVRFTGWVSDAELEGLYRFATCLAFPSLAEGFGLPVLEAMSRGLPVACSDAASLPEVAGDAALLFDPTDVSAIAAALTRLLSEPQLRERLAAAGRERAAGFSWERAADGTLASYERALASEAAAPSAAKA